jgi:hypothetical protein
MRGVHYNRDDNGGALNRILWYNNTPAGGIQNAASPYTTDTPPASLNSGTPALAQHGVQLNRDGTKLFVPGGLSLYRIATRSSTSATTWTNVNLAVAPTDPLRVACWTRDGQKLIALTGPGSGGNFMFDYDCTGAANWPKRTNNPNQPPGSMNCVASSW